MTDYLNQTIDLTDPAVVSIFDEQSFWAAQFGRLLFDNLQLAPNLRILDVGCATGFPLFELAHRLGSRCHITGMDIWRPAIQRAAHKRRVYGLDYVSLVIGDALQIPFPTDHFDLIVSNLGVNNFENPAAALAECARVAKAGARLVITTNLKGHMHEFYAAFRDVLTTMGKTDALSRLQANEDHRGTQQSHTAVIEQAGFNISTVVEDQFTIRFVDGSALMRHFLTRVGFLGGWRAVVRPAEERQVFQQIEKRLNAIARQQGMLTMTIPMLYLEAKRN